MPFSFAIPLISAYSAKVQISILAVSLLLSYLNGRARLAIQILTVGYLVFKIGVPILGWIWLLFKGVAMFGFYIYFFKKGLDYALYVLDYLLAGGLETLLREMNSQSRSRTADEL